MTKFLVANFDTKKLFTIEIASFPDNRIIATAPTPADVVNAIIVSELIVLLAITVVFSFAKIRCFK
ncbi:MAG: hypothetical protein V3U80_04095 [Flavobacteriaceae bacterium]